MDTEDKLNMSLDDLSARRTSTSLGARRASRRPAPYGGRGGGAPFVGGGMRGYPSMGGRPEVCNNCKMPGHIARECTNLAVCNNCGAPGHLAASCSSEVVCRNCKQTGHIASECTNEPVCHVCKKPGHLAFGCAAANLSAPIPKSQLCNNCFKPGHIASECKNEVACNNCRQTGHKARDCTNPPVCNNCGQTGHMARSCTAQLAGPACHSCGMVGHLARNCPHGATMMRALQPMMGIPPVAAAAAFPMAQLVAPTMAVDPNVICRNCRQPGHYARDCGQPVLCNNCGGRGHFAADCPSDSRTLRGSRR